MADNKPKSSFLTSTFENIAKLNTAKVEEEQKQIQTMQRDFNLLKDALVFSIDQPLENIARTLEIAGYKNPAAFLQNLVDGPQNYKSAVEDFLNMQDDKSYNFNYDYMPRAVVEQFGQIAGSLALKELGELSFRIPFIGPFVAPYLSVGLPTSFQAAQTVGPIALERARNNNRSEPNWDDWREAGGVALTSGLIDTYGVFGIKRLNSTIFGAAVREGLTEGTQSLLEQAGGTAFTEKGLEVDPEQAVGETLIGGGSGAAVQTPFSISKAILKADLDKEKAVDAEFEEVTPNVLADNSLPPTPVTPPVTPFALLEEKRVGPRPEFDEQFSLLGAGELNLESRRKEADFDFEQAVEKRLDGARQYLNPDLSKGRYVQLLDKEGVHLGNYSKEEYLALLDKINLEITEVYDENTYVSPTTFSREVSEIAERFTEVQLRNDVYEVLKDELEEVRLAYSPASIKGRAIAEDIADKFSKNEFQEISTRLNNLIGNLPEATVQYLKTHLTEYQNEIEEARATTSARNQPEVKANVIRQYFKGTPDLQGSIEAELDKIFREKAILASEQPLTDTRFKGTGDAFTTEERNLVTSPELQNRKTNVEQTLSNIIQDIVFDPTLATSNQFKNPETDVFSTLGPRLDLLSQLDNKPNYTPAEIRNALSSRLDVFTDEYANRNYIDSVPRKQKGNTINVLEAERKQAQDELNQTGIGKLIQLRQSENSLIALNELYKMIDDFNRRFDYVETNFGYNPITTYREVVKTDYLRANFNRPELLAELNQANVANLDERTIKNMYNYYGEDYPAREAFAIKGPVLGMSQTGFRFRKMAPPDVEEQLQQLEEIYKDDVSRLRVERQKILEENGLEFNDYEAGANHPQSIYWTRNQFRKIFDVNTPIENLNDANTAIGIGKGIIEGQSDAAARAKEEFEAVGLEDDSLDALEETKNALQRLTGDSSKRTALSTITNFEIKLRDNDINVLNNVAPRELRLVLDEYIKAREERAKKRRQRLNILTGNTAQDIKFREGIFGTLMDPVTFRNYSSRLDVEEYQRLVSDFNYSNEMKPFVIAQRFKMPILSAFLFSLLEGDGEILKAPVLDKFREYVPFQLPGNKHSADEAVDTPLYINQRHIGLRNIIDPENKILAEVLAPAYRKTLLDNVDWFAEKFADKEQSRLKYFEEQLSPRGVYLAFAPNKSYGNRYVDNNKNKIREILQREIDRGPRTKEEIAKQLKAAIKKHENDPNTSLRNFSISPIQVFSPAALEEIGEAFMSDPDKATALSYDSFQSHYGRPGNRYNEERNRRLFYSAGASYYGPDTEVARGPFLFQPLSSLGEDGVFEFRERVERALKINARGPKGFIEEYELAKVLPKSMPQELKNKNPEALDNETLQKFLNFYNANDELLNEFRFAFVFDKEALGETDYYKVIYNLGTERQKYETIFQTEQLLKEFNDKFFRDKTMEVYQEELKKVLPPAAYTYFDENKGIMEEAKQMLALEHLTNTLENFEAAGPTMSKYKEMPLSKSGQVARDAVRKEIKKLLTDPNEQLATHFFIPYKLANVVNGQGSTVGSYELMQKELRALHKRIAEKYPELNLPEPFDVRLNVGSGGIFATEGTKDQIEDRIEDQKGKKETFDKADKALALDIRQLRELFAQDPTILQVRGYKKGGLVV